MKYLFNDIFNNKGKIETLVTFISCRYLKDIIDMSNDIGNTPILSSLIDNNIDSQQYRSSYRREEYAEARTHPLLKPNSHASTSLPTIVYLRALKGFSYCAYGPFPFFTYVPSSISRLSFSRGIHSRMSNCILASRT